MILAPCEGRHCHCTYFSSLSIQRANRRRGKPHRRTSAFFRRRLESVRMRSFSILMIFASILSGTSASAAPIAVRYKEGLLHGFLVLSTLDGDRIAEGDLTEVPHGNRITSHLIFRFKDGSRQEESVIFSQRRDFRIVSYHLVQKGPAFPHAMEVSIETSTGQVTVKYTDSDGKEKTESERLKLPPDLSNGLGLTVLKNLPPDSPPVELSMVVPTPKPR